MTRRSRTSTPALNVDANNADAWAGLGVAYEKQNNKIKAMESYSRAITVDPSNQVAHDGHVAAAA